MTTGQFDNTSNGKFIISSFKRDKMREMSMDPLIKLDEVWEQLTSNLQEEKRQFYSCSNYITNISLIYH